MKLGRSHGLLVLAFLAWAALFYGSLGLAGAAYSFCFDDGHYLPQCNWGSKTGIWFAPIAISIGGAWLMKRLALRLGIKID